MRCCVVTHMLAARTPLLQELHACPLLDWVLEVCALREEVIVEHDERVDGLEHARRAERMPRERLGRAHHRLHRRAVKAVLDGLSHEATGVVGTIEATGAGTVIRCV